MSSPPTEPPRAEAPDGEPLTLAEHGVVLVALLHGLAPEAATRGLGPDSARRCAAAIRAMAALPRTARLEKIEGLALELAAPVPRGLERVHRTWLEPLFLAEPPGRVLALVAGLDEQIVDAARGVLAAAGHDLDGLTPDVPTQQSLIDMRRALFAPILPMPEAGAGFAGKLCALTPDDLLAHIVMLGAGGAEASPAVSAATGRRTAMTLALGRGLTALAGKLVGTDGLRQVAQRLPRPAGEALLRAAPDPSDHVRRAPPGGVGPESA